MIHLDTSVLIDALTGPRRSLPALRQVVADGIRLGVSALVLYEWRRGPRTDTELAIEAALLGPEVVVAFGEVEARMAADLYRRVSRARGRELDLAIAACALSQGARVWTLNRGDFLDIPGLELHRSG
ncbi:MAG TPA: type II toxin-antitoxin system VapC family toxin [Vicinamibacterales bacterium]|nr:type II toxin-antitoxin system VapC family toxin [Vicinamibacterales bacterium]